MSVLCTHLLKSAKAVFGILSEAFKSNVSVMRFGKKRKKIGIHRALQKRSTVYHQAKVTIGRDCFSHFHYKGRVNNIRQASLVDLRQYLIREAPAVIKVCQNIETKYFHP